MKKIITIVGARPQIIKSSAISRAIASKFAGKLEEVIVHTGQHYDQNMSEIFFDEMKIPRPKYNLQVGSGGHGAQTAKMLEGLEKIFQEEQPTAVLVYGDTNSTIAGALAASKIHIPVVHVEAGLRSYNKRMPEEINRIACDHMSTLLFTPTKTGLENLEKEGFSIENRSKANLNEPAVFHCGDIMYDNSLFFSSVSEQSSHLMQELGIAHNSFILCTIHRDANTDISDNLNAIFRALIQIQEKSKLQIILPLHPRTKKQMTLLLDPKIQASLANNPAIQIIEPAGFLDIIALEKNAALLVTDSGGLQKEAFFFQKPCIILRPQTEWVEIVDNGNAILTDSDEARILAAFDVLMSKKDYTFPPFYGDGKAAEFMCEKINQLL